MKPTVHCGSKTWVNPLSSLVPKQFQTVFLLFTRGRIHKQKTLKYLPAPVLTNTIVITVESEIAELRETLHAQGILPMLYLSFPDSFRLVEKRYWTVKWLSLVGLEKFMFMDDDLGLSVVNGDKYRTAKSEDGQKLLMSLFKTLPSLLNTYGGVGISAGSRNNRNYFDEKHTVRIGRHNLFIQTSTKSCGFFGYQTSAFLRNFRWAEEHDLLKDIAYIDMMSNIKAVNNQGEVARLYNIAWQTTFDTTAKSGGMNLYRDRWNDRLAYYILLLMFPGCFYEKPDPRDMFGGSIRINRRAWVPSIDWVVTNEQWIEWEAEVAKVRIQLKAAKPEASLGSNSKAVGYLKDMRSKMLTMARSVYQIVTITGCIYLIHSSASKNAVGQGKKFTMEDGSTKDLSGFKKKIQPLLDSGLAIRCSKEVETGKSTAKFARSIHADVMKNWNIIP